MNSTGKIKKSVKMTTKKHFLGTVIYLIIGILLGLLAMPFVLPFAFIKTSLKIIKNE